MKQKNKSIGERIRELREKEGLTQEALASLCGWTSHIRLKKYESGAKLISFEDALSVARVLGVVPALFFAEETCDVEFIKHKYISIPVVGEVIDDEVILENFVLTHEGAYSYEKYIIPKLYSLYALKLSKSCSECEYSDNDVLIVTPGASNVEGEYVIVKYGMEKYNIKKNKHTKEKNEEVASETTIVDANSKSEREVFFVIGTIKAFD